MPSSLRLTPLALLLCTALLTSTTALAQEPEAPRGALVTDRPDVAESSRTVGSGTFQVEVGADISEPTKDERAVVFPLKLRQGISPNFEFHIETDTFQISQDGSGLTAPEIGSKWHIGDGERWSLGLLTALSIPLNDTQGYVFAPTVAMDFDLGRGIGLGTNVGATIFVSPRETGADNARFAASLGKGWSDKLGTYIEGFGEVTFSGTLTVATDFGFTYKFTDNIQVDAYGRQGLYQRDDLGAGLGFSLRI